MSVILENNIYCHLFIVLNNQTLILCSVYTNLDELEVTEEDGDVPDDEGEREVESEDVEL